ncbi:MAG: DNRLRE domain-containing protein [Desulfitobacteriaceae bacterium]
MSYEPVLATFIDSWMKEQNFSNAKHYFLGLFRGKIRYRILFKFDFTNLPIQCNIVEANLRIYCSRNDCMAQQKFYNVHPVTQDWSAQTATWLAQPSFNPTEKAQTCVGSDISEFITWDITSIVKGWHNHPNLNKGMIIKAEDENEQESLLGFLSHRQENRDWKPLLELTLLIPDQTPLYVNSRPKVAILTPQFFEWNGNRCLFGGGERYLIDFAKLLQKMGFIVDVFQPSTVEWEKTYEGVRITGFKNTGIEIDFLVEANRGFFHCTSDYNFHVYFNLNVIYPNVYPGSIVISHGIWWDSTERPWWRTKDWYQRLFTGLENVDTLVSVDTNTINWLNAVKPELELKKIYIPNYVDLYLVNPNDSSNHGAEIHILYPRRLQIERGWSICKKVAQDLVTERTDLRFLFVGRGSEEFEKSMRIFAAGHPRIEYFWHDMREMYHIYQDADIVLVPSLSSEGTSFSLIEAMAYGKPVIAGLVGGLTDVIFPGYNGLLIEVTPENLKKSILQLVDNPELRLTMGKNARSVAEQFSKTLWEERWNRVISDCFTQHS